MANSIGKFFPLLLNEKKQKKPTNPVSIVNNELKAISTFSAKKQDKKDNNIINA